MAQRLTVVLSQTPHAGSKQRAFEEELVPQLLMESHLDLTVIPHLEQLQSSDTGLLCLQGISGPMVLISWLPPAKAHAELERCGVEGRRARHELDTEQATHPTSGRPVYFVDLNACTDIEKVVHLVRHLRDDLQVKTVSVDSLLGSLRGNNMSPQPVPVEPPRAGITSAVEPHALRHAGGKQPPPAAPPPTQPIDPSINSEPPASDPDDSNLDALLDELDRFH
ncbi:MAG: hypothetical protein KatS3mg110_1637 [Pirellulaceae bacterium]|nr:MAG: hypothetical protein KatS3mg110_1637 [Pirellulaceae bacterium]